MSALLNDNDDVMNSLLRALCDPGQITDRAPDESLESWQRRAVIDHAVPYIAAAERERLRSLLPYNVNCCDAFAAAVADLLGEHEDTP